ncbi:MAG TPA: calcium/proton exchanger [Candidatus Acidoferrales bacterium]|nr:calcium/proton exchanger [Candidatus Acidoferrales bacterium]
MSRPRSLLTAENALSLLLVFVPAAAVLEWLHVSPLAVFVTSALAIIPLAGLMGKATEHLAEQMGEGIGGLLNATFGNAAELIIALMALRAGLHEVVKASLTGSIIGNILLVFGLAALWGGLRYPTLRFNRTAAAMGSTLLALAAIGLVVPAIFHLIARGRDPLHEQELSFEIAVVLFATYLLSLLFTLRTHSHLYTGECEPATDEARGTTHWSRRKSVGVLLAATALVALMSELLVGSIEHAAAALGMSDIFVGVILVAIIGNAAEHSTAVLVARKNKMDLAVNIAVGSSLQVALFVAPVLVFVSYAFGRPMDLLFTPFEVLAVTLSVLVLNMIASDGESNWMEGVQLLAVYLILAIAFYFLP